MSGNALFPIGAALVLGASGGIGGKVADVLASDGCDLALGYNRKKDRVDALAAKIATNATTHQCDVTDRGDRRAWPYPYPCLGGGSAGGTDDAGQYARRRMAECF